jgi:hypothetical protein
VFLLGDCELRGKYTLDGSASRTKGLDETEPYNERGTGCRLDTATNNFHNVKFVL